MCASVDVRVYAYVFVCRRVRTCVGACVRVRMFFVCVHMCVHARVCVHARCDEIARCKDVTQGGHLWGALLA